MTAAQQRHNEWLQYADEDRQMAEIALKEGGPPNQICFHAQQLAEKCLKAFLTLHSTRFAKAHQLPYVLELCEGIDESFKDIREDIFFLNRFYIETRYPGDIEEFSEIEAKDALRSALRVRDHVILRSNKQS